MKKKLVDIKKTVEGESLKKMIVKIGLERVDTQERIIVEALLDSRATGLVMSSELTKKKGFKLKKIERSIYVRNMNGTFNKKEPIKYMVEVNIYYQRHRERTVIRRVCGQTLGLGLVDRNRIVVIISLQWRKNM